MDWNELPEKTNEAASIGIFKRCLGTCSAHYIHMRTPPVALMTYPGPCHILDIDTDDPLIKSDCYVVCLLCYNCGGGSIFVYLE